MGSNSGYVPAGPDSAGPAITVVVSPPQLVVVGRGFSPEQWVTVRVIDQDEMADYLQYLADATGGFIAALPTSISRGIVRISVTDSAADPLDETRTRWAGAAAVVW
jgi:hypothetical protein